MLIVAGLTAVAAVLRFARIAHQTFWYDESFTVLLVHHSPSQMLGLLLRTELTPRSTSTRPEGSPAAGISCSQS